MTTADADPFASFKAAAREAWPSFAPVEIFTIRPAAELVKFAQVAAGQRVLDAACGTGVVAVTAARRGAKVSGLDLTPALLDRARYNAATAAVDIDFTEGDIETLPYPDSSFDVVLSQFGHIFAPRPALAVKQMLRVLKPGGCIAFSTWPAESFVGRQFAFVARHMPAPPAGSEQPAPAALWGDPNVIRERLGEEVTNLVFWRGTMILPSHSPEHSRIAQEKTSHAVARLVDVLKDDPAKLARVRAEYVALIAQHFDDNAVHSHFLMTRAVRT